MINFKNLLKREKQNVSEIVKTVEDGPVKAPIVYKKPLLDDKVSAALSYFLGPLSAIVFYAISREPYVKFHAAQSLFLWVFLIIFYGIFSTALASFTYYYYFDWLMYAVVIVTWVFMMITAYRGKKFMLPFIGNVAEKYTNQL